MEMKSRIEVKIVCDCGSEFPYPHYDRGKAEDYFSIYHHETYVCAKCGREMKVVVSKTDTTEETDIIKTY